MLIDTHIMMLVSAGIRGVVLLNVAQHISHGFGQLEITK